jgi:hypothetical protein
VWRALGWRSERRGLTGEAEAHYQRALEISRQQGALAWEVRAGLNLAGLWTEMDRPRQAMQLLDETCAGAARDSGDPWVARVREFRDRIGARLESDRRNP